MPGFWALKAAFIERFVSQFGQESRFSVPASFRSAVGRAAVKAGRKATAQAARNAALRAVSPMACCCEGGYSLIIPGKQRPLRP